MAKIIINPVIDISPEALSGLEALRKAFKDVEVQVTQAAKKGTKDLAGASGEVDKQKGLIEQLRARIGELKRQKEAAFDAEGVKEFNKQLAQAEAKLKQLESLGRGESIMSRVFGSAADYLKANIAIQSFDQLASLLGRGVKAAIDTEQFEQSLSVLLGSAEKAREKIKELTDFAAKTPFEMPQIQAATKTLLAFGISNDELMVTLKRLGDTAAITGTNFDALARMFGQIRATQVAYTGDLNQFANAGIPIYEQLAKQLNITEAEVKKLAGTGQIGFDLINEAFRQMTSEGGKFADGMIKQSETLGGVLSTLSDSFNIMLMKVIEPLIPSIKAIATALIEVTDWVSEFIKLIVGLPKAIWDNKEAVAVLAIGIGLLNAELIKSSAIFIANQARVQGMIVLNQIWAATTKAVEIATKGLNATLRANPIAFVIGSITTLVGALALLYNRFTFVKAGVDALWAATKATGQLFYELIRGPIKAFATAASGIVEIFKGNFTKGLQLIGQGFKDLLVGNLKRVVQGVPAIGRAAAAAWNKAYAEEAKKGAGNMVKDKLKKEEEQRKVISNVIGDEAKVRAKYVKQLAFERKAIEDVTDSLRKQTEALKERRIEAGRNAEIELNYAPGLAKRMIETEEERSRLILQAQQQRVEAEQKLEQVKTERIKDLAKQRAEFEERLAKARFEGATKQEIAELVRVIGTYEAEIAAVEAEAKQQRIKINEEFQGLVIEIEKTAYNRRRIEAARATRELIQQQNQINLELEQLTRELTASLFAGSSDPQKQRVAISLEFQLELAKFNNEVRKARERLAEIEKELSRPDITGEEINALTVEYGIQEEIIRSFYLRREKIVTEWNKKDLELERKISEERIKVIEHEQQEFERIVTETGQLLASSPFELGFVDGYAKALSQLANLRRSFNDTAIADDIKNQRAYIESQLKTFETIEENETESMLDRLLRRRRLTNDLTYEEERYIQRYEELLEQQRELEQREAEALAQFKKQRINDFVDFTADLTKNTLRLINQVVDMQIQALDRNIRAQERHVDEAERIAETGNARQLALERDRLAKLQEERAKFVRQQQALAAIELIINASIAVAKAAAAGGPAAPITIALTLAALAVGLAQARAQAQAAASGFKKGGYTGDGPNDRVAGVVHAGEFVVSADKTAKYRPLLEQIQRGEVKGLKPLYIAPELNPELVATPIVNVDINRLHKDLIDVIDAIKAIPSTHFSIDERGFTKRIQSNFAKHEKRSLRR